MRNSWGRRLSAFAASTALLLTATACTGDDGPGGGGDGEDVTPEEALAAAKTTLDETSGVRIGLVTTDSSAMLRSASGVATHDPAFEGTLTASLAGSPFEVPVVAVDGKVYAELPFTSGMQEVDPSEFQAPDPAQLMATEGGFSDVLTEVKSVKDEGEARNEENPDEVLRTISGTVPGSVAERVVPSAEGDFDATFEIIDNEELRRVSLTGVFYPGKPELTYTVSFTDYGTDADIKAP